MAHTIARTWTSACCPCRASSPPYRQQLRNTHLTTPDQQPAQQVAEDHHTYEKHHHRPERVGLIVYETLVGRSVHRRGRRLPLTPHQTPASPQCPSSFHIIGLTSVAVLFNSHGRATHAMHADTARAIAPYRLTCASSSRRIDPESPPRWSTGTAPGTAASDWPYRLARLFSWPRMNRPDHGSESQSSE